MRVEQLYYQEPWFRYTQMYIACAHLEVKGPGGGTPGPMVRFPGAYDSWDRCEFHLIADYFALRYMCSNVAFALNGP